MAKFTTNEIISLFKALTDLRGSPAIVTGESGKPEPVYEPFPMSEKAKWNAAKNRSILKRFVVANDEIGEDAIADLHKLKLEQRATWANEQDPQMKAQKRAAANEVIQGRVDELNQEATRRGRLSQDVEGLLTIPATGLCLKSSKVPPTVISELMVLIDGEPEFEAEKPKPAK